MKKQLIVSYVEPKENNFGQAFTHLCYDYKHFSELGEGEFPQFAIVDDYEKMNQLRNNFEKKEKVVQFVFVGRNYKLQEFFDLNGSIIVDPTLLQIENVTKLIRRSITSAAEIHLQEIFNKGFEKYFSYKITNIYRLGYFADLLCKDAATQKLNFVSIRTFFDHAMLLNSYLVDLGLATFPCEMEFAFKENQLVLLLHLSTEGIKQNHLVESLGEENSKNPMSSLLRTCFKQADYLDVMNYPKAKRLTIIGLWVSEEQRSEITTPSISIKTIDAVQSDRKSNESEEFNYDFNHQSNPDDLEKLDEQDLPALPGAHKNILEVADDSVFRKEEGLLQEITSFVQNQVEIKNLELDDPAQAVIMSDLSVEEVKKILKDHPDQELVQKFKKDDEQLLTSLVVSGKAAEELIQVVSGKVAKEQEEMSIRLSSGAEEISNQITVSGNLFKEKLDDEIQFIASSKAREKNLSEVIMDPGIFLEDAEFEIAGSPINLDVEEKQVIVGNIKEKLTELSTDSDFLALSPDEQQNAIEEQVQVIVRSAIPKAKQSEIQKISKNKKPEVDEDIKIAMGSIEKELVTKFTSKNGPLLVEDQIQVITDTIMNNAMNVKTVLKGNKPVEEAVEEIIEQMSIPEEQKKAFKKKIAAKVKKNQKSKIVQKEVDEIVEEEIEEEEVLSTGEKKIVKKIVKVPKKVIKKVKAPDEVIEEIVYEDEITEVEEVTLTGEKKKVKKVVKVPKKVIKSKEVDQSLEDEVEETIIDEGEETIVEAGSPKFTKEKKKILKGKAANLAEEVSLVSGEGEDEGDGVQVVGGRNTFKTDEGYKVSKSKNRNHDNNQDADDSLVIDGDDDALNSDGGYKASKRKKANSKNNDSDDDSLVIDGDDDALNSDGSYKVKIGSGSKEDDDGYKVKVGGEKAERNNSEFKVSDNSHLVSKIEELEKKLQKQKQLVREMEKAQVKEIKEMEMKVDRTPVEEIEAVANEIKEISGLSNMQKEKMLQVIESEKKMNEKYTEISEAYRKNKMALDTLENKFVAEIDELERGNRHKELLVEQMKTKVNNLEKDHQVEIKRITFDLKKQQQRSGLADTDKYKQKITSLEREKNNMKRTLDELKANMSKEKVKVINQVAKDSPKIAETEAQKKRVEVKLQAATSELAELKKAIAAKDSLAKEVGSERFKLEAEANKWKKEALTKQSEIEKAHNEKVRAESALLEAKKKLEELAKDSKSGKKNEVNVQHATQENKASLASVKQAEDKILQLKEEMNKEKVQLNKDLAREREQLEQMKKNYLIEANKSKALETKAKEMAEKIAEQEAEIKSHDSAVAEATTKATTGAGNVTAKDLSALATKNRILEDTSKKITKDFNETKAKLDESKKEIANLTKKANETSFKLQEKEKLAEKLQNELKAIKDKEAEAKKKEGEAKKAA